MTSAERTIALSELARQIAFELNQITPLRPWTFVLPTEDVYSVHLRNAGKARIYIQFDQYENPKRLSVSGYQHIGKNGQFVEVYENVKRNDYTHWERVTVPSITVAISRGPEAIAKDIAKRFLPEYLRIFALAEEKVATDAAYEAKIETNLQRLAAMAGVNFHSEDGLNYRGEQRKSFSWKVGTAYHEVKVNDHDADLKLNDLTFEQAEKIITLLKHWEKHSK
jgi:hypothetical protein